MILDDSEGSGGGGAGVLTCDVFYDTGRGAGN